MPFETILGEPYIEFSHSLCNADSVEQYGDWYGTIISQIWKQIPLITNYIYAAQT